MTKGRPWYKRYPSDFLHGTAMLSCEEKGAYSVTLDLMYERGGAIPADATWIARMCGCSVRKWTQTLLPALITAGKLRVAEDGRLTNGRMEFETHGTEERSAAAREAGRKGGLKKAAKAEAAPIISDLSPIYRVDKPEIIRPEPSEINDVALPTTQRLRDSDSKEEGRYSLRSCSNDPDGFDAWYAVYPRKVGKGEANRAYGKALKGGATQGDLLDGLLRYEFSPEPRYQPMPATWLNKCRWQHDLGTAPPTVAKAEVDHKTRMQQISRASLFDEPTKAEHDGVTINLNPGEWNDD